MHIIVLKKSQSFTTYEQFGYYYEVLIWIYPRPKFNFASKAVKLIAMAMSCAPLE